MRPARRLREAQAEAFQTLAEGGTLLLYGGEPPEDPDRAPRGVPIFRFPVVGLRRLVDGGTELDLPIEAEAATGGRPRWARFLSAAGEPLGDGSVGTKRDRANIVMNVAEYQVGDVLRMRTLRVRFSPRHERDGG